MMPLLPSTGFTINGASSAFLDDDHFLCMLLGSPSLSAAETVVVTPVAETNCPVLSHQRLPPPRTGSILMASRRRNVSARTVIQDFKTKNWDDSGCHGFVEPNSLKVAPATALLAPIPPTPKRKYSSEDAAAAAAPPRTKAGKRPRVFSAGPASPASTPLLTISSSDPGPRNGLRFACPMGRPASSALWPGVNSVPRCVATMWRHARSPE